MAHSLRNQLASHLPLARPHTLSEIGELKARSRSLCDAPIDVRLCCWEQAQGCAERLTDPCSPQPCGDLMLYLFELTLNRGLASPIKEPNVPAATVSETAAVLLRFL
jgi:hypothetical protein